MGATADSPVCGNCGATVREEDTACRACGAIFAPPLAPQQDKAPLAITVLKFCAWLDLAVSAVAGFIILINPDLFAPTLYQPLATLFAIINPVGVLVALAICLQGVCVCPLFLVIASIAENLIAIRRNTAPR